MDELTVKHERLARVATAVVIAIIWALCAFVTFTVSEADDTVLSMTDQGSTSGTLDVIPWERSARSARSSRRIRNTSATASSFS